jgi:hypothetical protein
MVRERRNTMKRLIIVLSLVAVLIALASSTVASADGPPGPDDSFSGVWEPVDSACDKRLMIRGLPWGYGLFMFDRCPTVCEGSLGISLGVGSAEGDVLDADFWTLCLGGGPPDWKTHSTQFTYDTDADTLSDGSVTWQRRGTD